MEMNVLLLYLFPPSLPIPLLLPLQNCVVYPYITVCNNHLTFVKKSHLLKDISLTYSTL